MPYGDELAGMERRTTGQLRPPGTGIHKRKSYKSYDDFHREEEHDKATNPYKRDYTTTGEDRKSHRPNRNIATGSPLPWQGPERYTASSSRTKTRGPSDLRRNEFLGPDPGAFQSNGKSRDERHHQNSPVRSHRSSGSRASHASYRDGLTPTATDMDVDYGSTRSPNYRTTPEPQYPHDPPTPGKDFPEEKRI